MTACSDLAKSHPPAKKKERNRKSTADSLGDAATAVAAYLRAVAAWSRRSLRGSTIVDALLCTVAGPGATGGV